LGGLLENLVHNSWVHLQLTRVDGLPSHSGARWGVVVVVVNVRIVRRFEELEQSRTDECPAGLVLSNELESIVKEVHHGQYNRDGEPVLWKIAGGASDSTLQGGNWWRTLEVKQLHQRGNGAAGGRSTERYNVKRLSPRTSSRTF